MSDEAKHAADQIHDLMKETFDPAARRVLMEHAEYYMLRSTGKTAPASGDPARYDEWERTMLSAIREGDSLFLNRPQTQAEAALCLIYRQYKEESFRQ